MTDYPLTGMARHYACRCVTFRHGARVTVAGDRSLCLGRVRQFSLLHCNNMTRRSDGVLRRAGSRFEQLSDPACVLTGSDDAHSSWTFVACSSCFSVFAIKALLRLALSFSTKWPFVGFPLSASRFVEPAADNILVGCCGHNALDSSLHLRSRQNFV